jgi:hypothetical protein
MREAVQRLTTIRFKLGDHVRDRDSGIRGTVVYVPSDPALAGSLIVRFSGSHNGLLVDARDVRRALCAAGLVV